MMQFTKGFFAFLFCLFFLPSAHIVAQQAPFTGGTGDGYDMASWGTQTSISADFSYQIKLISHQIGQNEALKLVSDQPIRDAEIRLLDMQGKEIMQDLWQHSTQKSLFVPHISPGVYFLCVKNQDRMTVKNVQILSK